MDFKKVLAVAAALAAGVFFWDSPGVYPLKLLVVFIHECSHALASLIVGGRVGSITINSMQGGVCFSAVPPGFLSQVVVSSAGYVGSALTGAVLLYVTLRHESGRGVLRALAAIVFVATVLWSRDLFTIGVGLALVLALGVLAKILPDEAGRLAALFLGAFTGLYAVYDLRDDLWTSARRQGTDAAILASHTYIPSVVWALLWSLLAFALLGCALWMGTKATRRRKRSAALAL